MVLEQGIHAGVHIDAYIRDPAPEPSLSTGTAASLLTECPQAAWFKHPRLNPAWNDYQKKTTEQDIGTVAHEILLLDSTDRIKVINPEDYPSKQGAVPKGWTNNAIREARDMARVDGMVPILSYDFALVKTMVETAQSALDNVRRTLLDGRSLLPERTLIFQDEGAWCRSRPDLGTEDLKFIVEYKTTGMSAHPEKFKQHIINMGYDLQAALIASGVYALTGENPEIAFLAQETSPPYLCSLVGLTPMFTDMMQRKFEFSRERWKKCVASNRWPGYPDQIAYVDPPAYEMAKVEMLE